MGINFPSADFTPQLAGYTGQGAFRFWCQKVLPIVYDDSLSYYELLNKVVNYLNNVIKDVSAMEDNIGQLVDGYSGLQTHVNESLDTVVNFVNELETYMNEYFDNLDVGAEIDRKLDNMVESGVFTAILTPVVSSIAPDVIRNWLDDNITPTTPIVDGSLTVKGGAADSGVTGGLFEGINADFYHNPKGYISHDSVILNGSNLVGKILHYSFDAMEGYSGYIGFYNSSDSRIQFIGKSGSTTGDLHYEGSVVIPENFSYAKVTASVAKTPGYVRINYLSFSPNLNELADEYYDKIKHESDENFIQQNLFNSVNFGHQVLRGVTISQESKDRFHYVGTPTATISNIIGTAELIAGHTYFVRLSDRPNSDPLKVAIYVSNDSGFNVGFEHNNYFTATADGTHNIRFRLTSDAGNVNEYLDLKIYDDNILSNKELSDATYSARNNANFISNDYTTIKARTDTLLGYEYVSFSSGTMVKGEEVYVNRGGHGHPTPEDQSEWGALLFTKIDKAGNITSQKFNYGGYTGEARDPNICWTRNGRLILSFATTYYYNSTPRYYNTFIELNENLEIVGSLVNVMPDVFGFGNTIQTRDGYLMRAAYKRVEDPTIVGDDKTYDVVVIYRSASPFTTNVPIASMRFEQIAELSLKDEVAVGSLPESLSEPCLCFRRDNIVCVCRAERGNSWLFTYSPLTGEWVGSMITVDESLGVGENFRLASPALKPYYDDVIYLFGSLYHADQSVNPGRDPVVCILSVSTSSVIAYKSLYYDASNNGYPGFVEVAKNEYGVMWYVSRGTSSVLMYKRIILERELGQGYIHL